MKLFKLVVATAGATVLLGALVGSASARSFSITSQFFRSTFRSLEFNGLFPMTCQVTLEGSLHARTIAKVLGRLIGYITSAVLGPCQTGTATILRETLPWHVRYLSFSGTLPNITLLRVNVIGYSFRIKEPGGITCLARSTPERPAIGNFNRDTATRALTTATIGGTIPTTCGAEGEFTSDNGTVTSLNSTTRITVTLI